MQREHKESIEGSQNQQSQDSFAFKKNFSESFGYSVHQRSRNWSKVILQFRRQHPDIILNCQQTWEGPGQIQNTSSFQDQQTFLQLQKLSCLNQYSSSLQSLTRAINKCQNSQIEIMDLLENLDDLEYWTISEYKRQKINQSLPQINQSYEQFERNLEQQVSKFLQDQPLFIQEWTIIVHYQKQESSGKNLIKDVTIQLKISSRKNQNQTKIQTFKHIFDETSLSGIKKEKQKLHLEKLWTSLKQNNLKNKNQSINHRTIEGTIEVQC